MKTQIQWGRGFWMGILLIHISLFPSQVQGSFYSTMLMDGSLALTKDAVRIDGDGSTTTSSSNLTTILALPQVNP